MSVRKRVWTTAGGEEREAWLVTYPVNGKRRFKTFDRKKDADAFHATVKVEVRQGIHTPDSQSKTVAEAAKLWLDACEAKGLERTTVGNYRQHVDFHIVPYVGRTKLTALTTGTVREFADAMRLGKPTPGETQGNKRSPDMVRRVLVSLGTLMADAQERNLVSQNVVRNLKRGGNQSRQQVRLKVGVDIPSPDEIRTLIPHLQGRWKPLLLTAIFTGLRASELRGLRWNDVDLKKGELHVSQRADRHLSMGVPKSKAGARTVPVGPFIVKTLREWKLKCPPGSYGLAFPSIKGQVQHHANIIVDGLIPAMMRAGLTAPVLDDAGKPTRDPKGKPVLTAKYTGLHSFRHFYASWCINRKADGGLELPLKLVSERLGHAKVAMTADTYGHLFARGDDGAELAEAERLLLA